MARHLTRRVERWVRLRVVLVRVVLRVQLKIRRNGLLMRRSGLLLLLLLRLLLLLLFLRLLLLLSKKQLVLSIQARSYIIANLIRLQS